MICTIIDIRGDYAYVKYQDTGVVSEVAIALLPFGVDVGDKLKFEDYEFTQDGFFHHLNNFLRSLYMT